MNKLFKKGCNLVNYQTYNNVKNSILISGGLVGISNFMLSISNVIPNGYMGYASSFLYFIYLYLHFSKGEEYTRDVNELRSLYNEFISNYNKMNSDFSFSEPISIFTMFDFLLNNGYLSLNHEFTKNVDKFYNLYGVLGTEVIAGSGVCRHVSSMLTDILNNKGIPSTNAICYMPAFDLEFLPIDKKNYSREENMRNISSYVSSSEEMEALVEKFDFLEEKGIYLTVKHRSPSRIDKKLERMGNHLITYSLYEGKSYYLDPTVFDIYRLENFKDGILRDSKNKKIYIKKDQLYRMNNMSDKEIKEFIKNMEGYQDSISLEMESSIMDTTRCVCVRNMDIFEKFYSDNLELYKEIENRLVKIKRKKS